MTLTFISIFRRACREIWTGRLRTGLLAVLWATGLPCPVWGQWTSDTGGIYYNGGNVGIGTTLPGAKLDIRKDYGEIDGQLLRLDNQRNVGGSADMAYIYDARGYAGANIGATIKVLGWETGDDAGALVNFATTNGGPELSRFYINRQTGNVGIGTISPTYKLSVNGQIGAKEVMVTNIGWADYVFKPGYRLRPLRDVAAYIDRHQRLPDIPSEAEVKEKGVGIGEMQAKLLAKIEELTLHMIEAEKTNRALEGRVVQLEAVLNARKN